MKTNAVRQLERENIPFELREYDVDEDHLEAERVAEQLGLETASVFKTIITIGDRTGPLFALTPAGCHLEPRLLADASHNKRIEVAPLKSVLELTGYIRGSVTPLAAKRAFPVFIDETVVLWPRVSISAGRRGLQILIAPDDLVRVTHATLADFARPA